MFSSLCLTLDIPHEDRRRCTKSKLLEVRMMRNFRYLLTNSPES